MILKNLHQLLELINGAAKRARRDPSLVTVTAITKYATVEEIMELLRTGLISDIGENRVQDAARKSAALKACGQLPAFRWRMTGHLQRNKVQESIELFDTVDSLDSLPLAEALESRLYADKRTLPVLVQVKLSNRQEQSGVQPENLARFLQDLGKFERLQVRGLMAIAPALDSVEEMRPYFRRMKELFDLHFPDKGSQNILSMGMSRDFEIAVEEGSNMVRIGSALFGDNRKA